MRIELDNVTRRFGQLVALDSVSLAFDRGSRTALVGPNGSGKSTMIRVIMGLLRCEGRVTIDGEDADAARAALAPRIAYVPQVAPRLQVTVGELLRAVARLRQRPTKPFVEAARALNLDVEAVGKKAFRTLSGGMRQKLLAAFALGSGAELMVLDEPTASMDAESRERFFDFVRGLEAEPTVVLCSHRLEEIRGLVDDVAALADGRLVRHGSVDGFLAANSRSVVELRTVNGASDAYLDAQGFERAHSGWWRAVVASHDRGPVVSRISSELSDALRDIVVRELEDAGAARAERKEDTA